MIGLDSKKSKKVAKELNGLLANFQVYYQTLRGLHWNIQGRNFFELHVKFEELYVDAQEKVDMLAERILTLGGNPLHTFSDYIKVAKVPVGRSISEDKEAVELIIESIAVLLESERLILESANDSSDEGTSSMMSDFITEQEKTMWMFSAWMH